MCRRCDNSATAKVPFHKSHIKPKSFERKRLKMKILSENRIILAYVGLGIEETVQFFGKRIPRKFIAIIFGFALIFGVFIASLLILNKHSQGPAEILMPICLLLSFISPTIIYISLMLKRKQIFELFDFLTTVVEKSNIFLLPFLFQSDQ